MSPKSLFPCGQTRREFVWQMGAGFAGLALSNLLAGDGFFARHLHAADAALNPLVAKSPPLAQAQGPAYF